jgi:serine/threonine-protein kinase PknG
MMPLYRLLTCPQILVTVFARPITEPDLRLGLEQIYRELARGAGSGRERVELVDRANRVRPRSWL